MVKNYRIDTPLITVTVLLSLFGLIMVYSTTMIMSKEKYGDSFYLLKKQLIWLTIGLILFLVTSLLKKPIYLQHKVIVFLVVLAIISLVLVFFTGKINNSYRWIKFMGFSIQPSEFAKIAVVLYLASVFSSKNVDVNNIGKLSVHLIPFLVVELLILKEPDMGTFLLLLSVFVIMLFLAGLKLRYFFFGSIFATPLLFLIIKMHPEKMKRVLAFLHPEDYVATYGFQTVQSIFAIGSGGIFGQGLGNSTQKLFFLPYAYSDFIFSIIGEEAGLIGALFVVALFFVFLMRGFNIARQSGSRQTYLLVMGLTSMIVIQAMINISVTLGVLPTKGIPLPFISKGGSSLISSLIIAGIIVNVSRHRKMVFIND